MRPRSSLPSFILPLLFLLPAVHSNQHTENCCRRRGVSDYCISGLCHAEKPPGDMDRYKLFDGNQNCSQYLADISYCMADGRDHTPCCEQTAVESEENMCFSLCRGAFPTLPPGTWNKFQTCIALNLPTIYKCYTSGYINSPSPPRELKILSKTADSVTLSWRPPSNLGELAHSYKVRLVEQSAPRMEETFKETTNTQITLNGLAKNAEYSVHVTAIGRDRSKKSLHSDIVNFNTYEGVVYSSVLSAGRASVPMPRESKNATIACRLRTFTEGRVHIEWEKQDPNTDAFRKVEGKRFASNYYMSGDFDPVYLSSLEIKTFDPDTDFGLYRCISRGPGRESAEVELVPHSLVGANSAPPETPLECCQRSFVRPECQSVCSPGAEPKEGLKPGAFLSSYGCNEEMYQLLQCSLAETRSAACCVRKKVPYYCIGLCDKDVRIGPVSGSCIEFMDNIISCHEETVEQRPRAVDDLEMNGDSETVNLSWAVSPGATVYHIYYRRKSASKWKVLSVSTTSSTVHGADQVVITAANTFGAAGAIRLQYVNGEWESNYE